MKLFGKKSEGEEGSIASKSGPDLKKYFWVFLLLLGIIAGAAIEHYFVEPFFDKETTETLSGCRASLNLTNQQVTQCLKDLDAARQQSQEKGTAPNSELCKTTENGWSCVLTNDKNAQELTTAQKELEQQFKQTCESQGGRWKCYGFCLSQYGRNCEFPFSDAGKTCTDPSQCKGSCVPVDNACQENCTGKCSTYPGLCFDFYVELINGKPKTSGVCD